MIGYRNNSVVRIGEEAHVLAEICDGAVQLLVPGKFAYIGIKKVILNSISTLKVRYSCNKNNVTLGQNTSANIKEFACISKEDYLAVCPLTETILVLGATVHYLLSV